MADKVAIVGGYAGMSKLFVVVVLVLVAITYLVFFDNGGGNQILEIGEGNQPGSLSALAQDYNVILILLDALRADHLGVYGYEMNTSPNIDLLARDAVLFENAFTQSVLSAPSHMSLLTSRYPAVHRYAT